MRQRQRILLIEDNQADVVMIRKAVTSAQIDAGFDVVYDGKAATLFFDAADADENALCPDV